ncbi:hypothetical protein P8S54_05445 [Thiomicrospira sp. R3]|uniref:hypothetical protein n=1 Tax=Thiomicrospira sp. R3 TaxID=3035472 RepID=UPI00259B22E1|nr:hypothetical protein [Thiomicrospira sp. R3]WFE69746.1 hypothetical protein P8S54_05445 [Thiomicrospira sp. R3]
MIKQFNKLRSLDMPSAQVFNRRGFLRNLGLGLVAPGLVTLHGNLGPGYSPQ